MTGQDTRSLTQTLENLVGKRVEVIQPNDMVWASGTVTRSRFGTPLIVTDWKQVSDDTAECSVVGVPKGWRVREVQVIDFN